LALIPFLLRCIGVYNKKTLTATTKPMGKLIQKHHRQLSLVVKMPPMIGPRQAQVPGVC
jgi:hypothetical protein